MGIILVALFLSGCGPAPEEQTAAVQEVSVSEPTLTPVIQITKTPAGTATPTTLEMLKGMIPVYEVYFDGEECIVEGPPELATGEYFFTCTIRMNYLQLSGWEAISAKEHLKIICFGGKKIARDKVLVAIISAMHLLPGITLKCKPRKEERRITRYTILPWRGNISSGFLSMDGGVGIVPLSRYPNPDLVFHPGEDFRHLLVMLK